MKTVAIAAAVAAIGSVQAASIQAREGWQDTPVLDTTTTTPEPVKETTTTPAAEPTYCM